MLIFVTNPISMRASVVAVVTLLSLAALGCAVALSNSLNWRARVITSKLSGQLPDVRVSDLAVMMAPGSLYALERLADTGNPFAIIKNPFAGADDVARGRKMFLNECSNCHGDSGQGGPGAPSLQSAELKHGRSDWSVFTTILRGVPSTAMSAHEYPRDDLWRLVAFVQSLAPSTVAEKGAALAHVRPAVAHVTYTELAATNPAASNWPTYSGDYSGSRHSSLEQITPDNVSSLTPKWLYQLDGAPGQKIECTPVVHEGHMYVTTPSGSVIALDAATGGLSWRYDRLPQGESPGWAGAINRGVALLDDRVYVGTRDAKLIALSAATGKVLWLVDAAEPKEKRHISSAPLALDGLVLIGTSGAYGRGSIAAFNAATGKEMWRFYTIPKPGETGGDSWAGESWREGGAPAWMTGAYDPVKDIVYWGVGNPAPDYNTAMRPGDNLYSNSLLALRGKTGQLLWHFQFTPGDDHDWDSAQTPIVARLGAPEDAATQVLFPNRNGFYYHLDGRNGKLVAAKAFVFQNWAKGIDDNGRPIKTQRPDEGARGILTYPSNVGATNWWPPSLDVRRGLVFVPAIERSQIFFPATPGHNPGPKNYPASSGQPHYTLVKALDAQTGDERWQYRFAPRHDKEETAGLLSTSSGLVFGGDLSMLVALRSTSGEALWRYNTGGQISAAPMSFSVQGRQYIAVAAGNVFMAFGLPSRP